MPVSDVPEIFAKYPEAAKSYDEIISFSKSLGKCTIEQKKTCAHVVAVKSAFLGIHPRKAGLRITIVLSRPLKSKRIVKCEKASSSRYHIDLDVVAPGGLDDEVKGWITEGYQRSAN